MLSRHLYFIDMHFLSHLDRYFFPEEALKNCSLTKRGVFYCRIKVLDSRTRHVLFSKCEILHSNANMFLSKYRGLSGLTIINKYSNKYHFRFVYHQYAYKNACVV